MVDLEGDLDAELGALLDREGLVLEFLEGAGRGNIDHDIGAAFDFKGEGLDDTCSRIVGVSDGVASGQTEGGFPAVERFVVLVWLLLVRFASLLFVGTMEQQIIPR